MSWEQSGGVPGREGVHFSEGALTWCIWPTRICQNLSGGEFKLCESNLSQSLLLPRNLNCYNLIFLLKLKFIRVFLKSQLCIRGVFVIILHFFKGVNQLTAQEKNIVASWRPRPVVSKFDDDDDDFHDKSHHWRSPFLDLDLPRFGSQPTYLLNSQTTFNWFIDVNTDIFDNVSWRWRYC